jgi:hypothetical protein
MNLLNFSIAIFFLIRYSKVTVAGFKTVVDIDEMRFSNRSEASFEDFTEVKFKKVNRTHRVMSGNYKVHKDIFEETGYEVQNHWNLKKNQSFTEFVLGRSYHLSIARERIQIDTVQDKKN